MIDVVDVRPPEPVHGGINRLRGLPSVLGVSFEANTAAELKYGNEHFHRTANGEIIFAPACQ